MKDKRRPWPAKLVHGCWTAALAAWDVRVELSPPSAVRSYGKGHDDPLAYIDLETRQVFVNFLLLDKMGARDSLTAVLAHEIGHHVRFPHTLGEVARLQVLETQLLPNAKPSLLNLFFDLQVNEFLGGTMAEPLCRVYQGFRDNETAKVSPQFGFYLAIYEELWAREPGSLVPTATVELLDKRFPGWRVDARVFVDTFFALPSTHLQFVYFCSRFLRYLDDQPNNSFRFTLSHDLPEPSVDDYAGALYGDPLADAAIEEAVRRGWIDAAESRAVASGRTDDDALTVIDRVSSHLPGKAVQAFRQTLVGRHYRKLAARYLLKLPADSPVAPEPWLPTVTTDWEQGDSLRSIDWTQSVLERAGLASIMPLRRELVADDGPPDQPRAPGAEIYLDTSGSMPRPDKLVNSMTLAAQIIALSALRKGGRVRGIVYSSQAELSDWLYGEEAASAFLLRYSGGGTDFPFQLLARLAAEDREVLRVVISDSDFLWNCSQHQDNLTILAQAADRSARLVLLLALPSDDQMRDVLAPVLSHPRVRVVTVRSLADLAAAAAALADSFLEPIPRAG